MGNIILVITVKCPAPSINAASAYVHDRDLNAPYIRIKLNPNGPAENTKYGIRLL